MPDLLLVGRELGDSDGRGNVGYLPWALCGFIEEAKAAAQTTFIPSSEAGGAGQDDMGIPAFTAYGREAAAARCLDASLAVLAVIAAQALHVTVRKAPPRLRGFVEMVREVVRPVVEDRVLGPELAELAQVFTDEAFALDRPAEQAVA
jgi:histidine ammonia-lyase